MCYLHNDRIESYDMNIPPFIHSKKRSREEPNDNLMNLIPSKVDIVTKTLIGTRSYYVVISVLEASF